MSVIQLGPPRPRPTSVLLAAALATLCGACTPTQDVDDSDPGRPVGGDGGGPGAAAGLPCEVAQLLRTRCQSCHGSPPAGGAPVALVTYEDLRRASPVVPTQTLAERSLARMLDAQRPMPPPPAAGVAAEEIALFQAWIAAGTPRGTCGGADGGIDPSDPFAGPPRCTSGRTWTEGDRESPLMHPGRACIACHTREGEGPALLIAGTVYPTGHEPDECYGVPSASGIIVEIVDASGKALRLPVNASGNFLLRARMAALALPYRARVLYQGRERHMVTPQRSGDCNGCHTQAGANGAPGRIVPP